MKKLLALLASLLLAMPALAKDEFHLYNWNNYIAPETIKRFEDSCKCTVVQTYYSDNEELLAKLAAGAKGYDMLVPTANAVEALIKGKQLKPIDKSQLPNLKKSKPYWAAFNASSYIKELTVGNIWLVHGYSNDIFQANLDAQAAKRPFHILQGMPKEGAVLAVDNMVIHKDAPRPDLALKFMNFMLEGRNSAELTNLIGSGNPNMDAVKYIKPEILKSPAIFPNTEV